MTVIIKCVRGASETGVKKGKMNLTVGTLSEIRPPLANGPWRSVDCPVLIGYQCGCYLFSLILLNAKNYLSNAGHGHKARCVLFNLIHLKCRKQLAVQSESTFSVGKD